MPSVTSAVAGLNKDFLYTNYLVVRGTDLAVGQRVEVVWPKLNPTIKWKGRVVRTFLANKAAVVRLRRDLLFAIDAADKEVFELRNSEQVSVTVDDGAATTIDDVDLYEE